MHLVSILRYRVFDKKVQLIKMFTATLQLTRRGKEKEKITNESV